MKKITRILLLVLSLVAIITAFTVVALADEPTFSAVNPSTKDFSNYGNGDTIQNESAKYGKMVAVKQDNGNVYMLMSYEKGTSGSENLDVVVSNAYELRTYPYVALDFDIMSPNGQHDKEAYVQFRLFNGSSSIGYFTNVFNRDKLNFSNIGLSNVPYDWQHVTIIIEQDVETLGFIHHIYINGEFVQSVTEEKYSATIGASGYDRSKLNISYYKFTVSHQYGSKTLETAIDNARLTYFTNGGTLDQMANYYYKNGDYTFPYKYTVATVTDENGTTEYYDDINKAIESADKNDIINLVQNGMSIVVNKEVTINANNVSDYTFVTDYDRKEIGDGVFEFTEPAYDFEKTDSTGTSKHFIEDLYNILNSADGGNTTIKLLRDVYTEMPYFALKKSIKIDLNGYDFERCYVYGSFYEATKNDASGDYEYTTANKIEEITNAKAYLYVLNAVSNVTLEISSSSGGNFYNFSMKANVWKDGDTVVKREALACNASPLSYINGGGNNYTFKLNGINVYAGTIIDHRGSKDEGITVAIDNVNYYLSSVISGKRPVINIATNKKIDVSITNSLIYTQENTGNLLSLGANSPEMVPENFGTVLIQNTTIIKNGMGWGLNITNKRGVGNTEIIFDNCKLYDAGAVSSDDNAPVDTYAIKGTLTLKSGSGGTSSNDVIAGNGWSNVTVSNIYYTYNLPSLSSGSVDTEYPVDKTGLVHAPDFNIQHTEKAFAFNTVTTKPVTVNWIGADGSTVEYSESLIPGFDSLNPPRIASKVLPDDPYRNIGYQWVDAAENGKVISEILGINESGFSWNDEYNFYAVDNIDGNIVYVGGIKDIYLNMCYYTNFKYNIYLPVDANLQIDSVSIDYSSIVKLYGEEYYVYTCDTSTTSAANLIDICIEFTINGEAYSQIVSISALRYAEMILNAPENDIETKAVANMVRYIKEARDLLGLENGTKFDELIDAHLDDYKSKDEYDDLDVDYSELSGVAVSFVVDRTNAGYRINLPGEKFANAVVKVNYLNGEEISLVKSETENIWHTNTTKVYDIVDKAIEITVTIPGEDGDTVVRGTYSVGAYIQATDNDMAKAMYEFGVAAKVYREWLQTK